MQDKVGQVYAAQFHLSSRPPVFAIGQVYAKEIKIAVFCKTKDRKRMIEWT